MAQLFYWKFKVPARIPMILSRLVCFASSRLVPVSVPVSSVSAPASLFVSASNCATAQSTTHMTTHVTLPYLPTQPWVGGMIRKALEHKWMCDTLGMRGTHSCLQDGKPLSKLHLEQF